MKIPSPRDTENATSSSWFAKSTRGMRRYLREDKGVAAPKAENVTHMRTHNGLRAGAVAFFSAYGYEMPKGRSKRTSGIAKNKTK